MSIKEKWNDAKQKREARAYFRSQNRYILKPKQYALLIGAGFIVAIVIGAAMAFIESVTNISFAILYIAVGSLMSYTMVRLSDLRSKQVGILSAVMSLVCVYMKQVITVIIMYRSLLMSVSPIRILILAFGSLFSLGLITWLFILAGMYIAYMRSL